MPPDQTPNRQSPTPSLGGEGSDLQTVAGQIAGLLDDDGHYNPTPDRPSRGHPDYDPDNDDRNNQPARDSRGRFQKTGATGEKEEQLSADDLETGDIPTEDTELDDESKVGDTNEEKADSADDDAATDPEDTDSIQTLAQLAEALETPIEELEQALTHTFTAAGEETTVTLAELVAGYQKDADYRRSTKKLADDRRAQEAERQQLVQQYEQQNLWLANQFNLTEMAITSELNDPRLARLRESDPAEWSARREEIGQRLNAVRQARQQAAAQYEQQTQQQQRAIKDRESKALLDAVPDFSPQHRDLARQALQSLGLADEEISNVFDHRLIVGALELAVLRDEVKQLKAEKAKATDAVKRVKRDIPKLQKPGKKAAPAAGLKRENIQRLRDRAKKTGSLNDAAKVIETYL